nr:MAG TPA: hypothetical protein [Caudoviricetes sp.]
MLFQNLVVLLIFNFSFSKTNTWRSASEFNFLHKNKISFPFKQI